MRSPRHLVQSRLYPLFLLRLLAPFTLLVLPAGCNEPTGTLLGGIGATTLLGGQSPAHEIQQVYYLGVFDPQEQLEPAVYRLTVHGQGSFLGQTRFASGWVPANFVDTLNTRIGFKADGGIEIGDKSDAPVQGIAAGRRLMMFGPEGFREAPRDHRLVIVMGTNPEGFFNAVGNVLQSVTEVEQEQRTSAASNRILQAMADLRAEHQRLADLNAEVKAELPETKTN